MGSFVTPSAALDAAHFPDVVRQRHTREEANEVKTTTTDVAAPLELDAAASEGSPNLACVKFDRLDKSRFRFCNFFAGEAALTAAVDAVGVPVRCPDDLTDGWGELSTLGRASPSARGVVFPPG